MLNDFFDELLEDIETTELIIFCTKRDIFFLILVAVLLIALILYTVYKLIRYRSFQWIDYYVALFYLVIILLFLIVLIVGFVQIEVLQGGSGTGMIFSLTVAIMTMPYMCSLTREGFNPENPVVRYFLLFLVLYLVLTGIGQIGIRITFNIDAYIVFVFGQKTFQSNSYKGVTFMINNVVIFLAIYAGSFLIDKKTS
jgi:hypothetical protein